MFESSLDVSFPDDEIDSKQNTSFESTTSSLSSVEEIIASLEKDSINHSNKKDSNKNYKKDNKNLNISIGPLLENDNDDNKSNDDEDSEGRFGGDRFASLSNGHRNEDNKNNIFRHDDIVSSSTFDNNSSNNNNDDVIPCKDIHESSECERRNEISDMCTNGTSQSEDMISPTDLEVTNDNNNDNNVIERVMSSSSTSSSSSSSTAKEDITAPVEYDDSCLLEKLGLEYNNVKKQAFTSKAFFKAKETKLGREMKQTELYIRTIQDEYTAAKQLLDGDEMELKIVQTKADLENERILVQRLNYEILRFCLEEIEFIKNSKSAKSQLPTNLVNVNDKSYEELVQIRSKLQDIKTTLRNSVDDDVTSDSSTDHLDAQVDAILIFKRINAF